jgi:eukaryotic-like serine/threonine-protein kinase
MADVPTSGETSRPFPERFGRYRIIKRLGAGGMGSVYLAEDTQLGRQVALKVPHFGPEDGPEARQRFFREASIAATLDHVYLCPVYDAGEVDGLWFLTMAYIEGKTLAETISEAGMPARPAAALMRKLALGLQEAHAKGVVHRDLKPANIMLKETGQGREPVIVDFGLARRDDAGELRVTKVGQVMGTLGYMAPEQIRGDPEAIGPACDIYALGVILYELLTGELPFRGTGLAVAGQILTQEPPPLVALRPDIAPQLEAICQRAMAKQVEDRYASMGMLATALGDYLRCSSPSATSSQPSPAQRHRPEGAAPWVRPALVAGVLLLALIVAGGTGGFKAKDKDGVIVAPPVSSPEPVPAPAPEEAPKEITNTIGMKLVLIPAGEFLMGAPDSDKEAHKNARPQHRVRITRPFYLGAHEVTQGQYRAVTGTSPSIFEGSDDLPVENVSWNDAIAFCTLLSEREGAGYRLPTEAEWEYACRAGSTSRYSFGDDASILGRFVWYSGNSGNTSHPVGRKQSNAWGLYDMHGNVWEWCSDWHGEYFYRRSPGTDPLGPKQAAIRVRRGGDWRAIPRDCQAAIRGGDAPGDRGDSLGFRLARVQSGR